MKIDHLRVYKKQNYLNDPNRSYIEITLKLINQLT